MVELQVRVVKDTVTPWIKKFGKEGRKRFGDALYKVALDGRKKLRASLTYEKIKWTGELWRKIEATKKSNIRSVVSVPKYGIYLDSMQPHFVPFVKRPYNRRRLKTGKRSITAWGRDHGFDVDNMAGIYVQPHPWIDRPWMLTQKNALNVMNRELNKLMR